METIASKHAPKAIGPYSQAIVAGPASNPCPTRSLRNRTINSTVASGTARGEVLGRRDRGSNAVSPSARYRASNFDTQPLDTPYAAATSPWV